MAAADNNPKLYLATVDSKYYGVEFPEPNGRVAFWESDGVGGITTYPTARAVTATLSAHTLKPCNAHNVRKFVLHRHADHHHNSGTGIAAVGVEFPDDSCAMGWLSEPNSVQVFDDIEHIQDLHGHEGSTEVYYSPDWEPR